MGMGMSWVFLPLGQRGFHTHPLRLEVNISFRKKGIFPTYIFGEKCHPSGAAPGTPATPHRLQHLTARLIQNGQQGLEIG